MALSEEKLALALASLEAEKKLEQGILPLRVRMELEIFHGLSREKAKQIVNLSLEEKRKFKQCEKVGHDWYLEGSVFSPESDMEWLTCRKCKTEITRYY